MTFPPPISEQLRGVLEQARWAPSGDNGQPWRVRATAEGLDVFLHEPRPAFLDIDLDATRIAVGAFAESCRLGAGLHGLCAELVPGNATGDQDPALHVPFRATDAAADPLAHHLTHRVSNRRMYQVGSVGAEELNLLRRAVEGAEGVWLECSGGAERTKALASAVGMADKVRFRNRACHAEFHAKVHWTRAAAAANPSGFDVSTFELGWHEKVALRLTRRYGLMRGTDLLFRMADLAAALARRQVRSSGVVVALCVGNRSPVQMLWAGVALQRLWLQATAMGLASQVLAVAPLLLQRLEVHPESLTEAERRQVERVRSDLAAAFPQVPINQVALLLRIGRADPPSAKTTRRPADALLGLDS